MWELLIVSVAFAAVLFVVCHAWEKAQEQMLAAAERGKEMRGLRYVRPIAFFVLLAPAVFSFLTLKYLFDDLLRSEGAPPSAQFAQFARFLALAAILVTPVLTTFTLLAVAGLRRSRESREGIRKLTETSAHRRRTWMSLINIMLIIAFLQSLGILLAQRAGTLWALCWIVCFVLLILIGAMLQNRSQGIVPGKPLQLEPGTPLDAEISAIARSFGYSGVQVQIRTFQLRSETAPPEETELEIAARLQTWNNGLVLQKPVLSMELLRRLDPDVITAVLALMYAKRQKLVRLPHGDRMADLTSKFGSVMLWIFIFCVFFLAFTSRTPVGPWIIYGFLLLSGLWVLLLVGAWTIIRLRGKSLHERAFAAWHDADPEANRTPEEYITALICHDRLLAPLLTDSALIGCVLGNHKIARFLKHQPKGTREKIIDRARAVLTEQEPGALPRVDAFIAGRQKRES